jgi:hypothetical protein
MSNIKAWDSREGSSTVVLVKDDELFIHTNLGWVGPVGHEGTALEAATSLAENWGLQECTDPARYVDDDPVEEEPEDDADDAEDDEEEEDDLDPLSPADEMRASEPGFRRFSYDLGGES